MFETCGNQDSGRSRLILQMLWEPGEYTGLSYCKYAYDTVGVTILAMTIKASTLQHVRVRSSNPYLDRYRFSMNTGQILAIQNLELRPMLANIYIYIYMYVYMCIYICVDNYICIDLPNSNYNQA